MFKKGLAVILVLTMMVAMLAGCNSETDSGKESVEANSETKQGTDPKTEKVEQVVRVTLGEGGSSLDPTLTTDGDSVGMLIHLFEGLVRADGKGNILPAAAKSWEVSEDGLVYTFKIDEKSKWSDGKPVTSRDFEYAFKRLADPLTASELSADIFFMKNGLDVVNGEAKLDVLGVKVIDDSTLEITMEYPGDYGLKCLDSKFPLREDIVSSDPDRWALDVGKLGICNGAFKIVELTHNDKAVLVKNDLYRDAENVKLDKAVFYFIPDSSTALSAYIAGKLECSARVPKSQVQTLLVENPEFYLDAVFGIEHLEFNTKEKPLDDVRVRKALSLAIDRKALAEKVVGGGVLPATGIIPYGYIADGVDFKKASEADYGIDVNGANVEAAKKLMAEAGYPNGEGFPRLVISAEAVQTSQRMSEAFVEMWKNNLGIDVEIAAKEFQILYDEMQTGDFQIAGSMIYPSVIHPIAVLDTYITGSGTNYTQYTNKEYDDLVNKGKFAADVSEGRRYFHQAEDFIMDKHIVAPLFYMTNKVLVKDYVKDHKMINGYHDFTRAYIESK